VHSAAGVEEGGSERTVDQQQHESAVQSRDSQNDEDRRDEVDQCDVVLGERLPEPVPAESAGQEQFRPHRQGRQQRDDLSVDVEQRKRAEPTVLGRQPVVPGHRAGHVRSGHRRAAHLREGALHRRVDADVHPGAHAPLHRARPEGAPSRLLGACSGLARRCRVTVMEFGASFARPRWRLQPK